MLSKIIKLKQRTVGVTKAGSAGAKEKEGRRVKKKKKKTSCSNSGLNFN